MHYLPYAVDMYVFACAGVKILHRVQVQSAACVRHPCRWSRHLGHHREAGPIVDKQPVPRSVPRGEGVFLEETHTCAVWREISQGSHWTRRTRTLGKVSRYFYAGLRIYEILFVHIYTHDQFHWHSLGLLELTCFPFIGCEDIMPA